MNARLVAPLFAAIVLTTVATSQNPEPPKGGVPFPNGPMADRLKHRLEELRRDGKNEEAERLEHHVREMRQQHEAKPQGERRIETPGNSPEREMHLAEAVKHLHAAGLQVSPDMLKRLGERSAEHGYRQPHFSRGSQPSGSPGGRPDSMHGHQQHEGHNGGLSHQGSQGAPSSGGPGFGAGGAPMEAMHQEIRLLARQVQELRGMIQQQHGGQRPNDAQRGEPNRGSQERGSHIPNDGSKPHDRTQSSAIPGLQREHRDGQPRGEARPVHPPAPANPPPHADRPPGGAPVPPPTN